MTQPGLISNILPRGADWIQRALRDLQRQLDELRGANTLNAATIDKGGLTVQGGGGITIADGGMLSMTTIDGIGVFAVGTTTMNDGSGRTQQAIAFARDDGSLAFSLADLGVAPGHARKQNWGFYDRSMNEVLAEDTNSGTGLARPYLGGGYQMVNTNIANWPSTTNAAFTDIATGMFVVQNPRMQWAIWLQADAATTGEFQVTVSGVQVGPTKSVTGNFLTWQERQVAIGVPVSTTPVVVNIRARRTAGTGTVRASVLMLAGDQSP